jgi:hypothetical protein
MVHAPPLARSDTIPTVHTNTYTVLDRRHKCGEAKDFRVAPSKELHLPKSLVYDQQFLN